MKARSITIVLLLLLTACGPRDPYVYRPTQLIDATFGPFGNPLVSTNIAMPPVDTPIPAEAIEPLGSPEPSNTPIQPKTDKEILFQDFFDDQSNPNGWDLNLKEYEYAILIPTIQQEVLHVESEFIASSVVWLSLPGVNTRDFTIEFDATILEPDSGNGDLSIAFSFRRLPPQNYYIVLYRNDGSFSFEQAVCSGVDVPCDITPDNWQDNSDLFTLPRETTNHFVISAKYGFFSFFVDGQKIFEHSSQDIFRSGYMAIGLYGGPSSIGIAEFDNIVVYVPE